MIDIAIKAFCNVVTTEILKWQQFDCKNIKTIIPIAQSDQKIFLRVVSVASVTFSKCSVASVTFSKCSVASVTFSKCSVA